MQKVATFRIRGSFNITGRGLVATGDIVDGRIKAGDTLTFNTGLRDITVKISGVEMGDRISTEEFFVGLTFIYKDDEEMRSMQGLTLPAQTVEIFNSND